MIRDFLATHRVIIVRDMEKPYNWPKGKRREMYGYQN